MKRTRKPTAIGIEIKMELFRQNMTIKELAERIKKSEATICEVISGKNRSAKTRELILKELHIDTEIE